MLDHIENLVFEGGGVKGVAYLGALAELEEEGIMENIERVGGTSVGAINALLLGLGYNHKETKTILMEMDFNNFLNESWGFVQDINRLKDKFGWYKGDYFRNWIGDLIDDKVGNPEATFRQVDQLSEENDFLSMYFVGTNLSTGYSEVFSHEHTLRMPIADAVRISMSLPLFFAAKRAHRGDVFIDGGLGRNYPIKLFDRKSYVTEENKKRETDYYEVRNTSNGFVDPKDEWVYNKKTLGFRLDSDDEIMTFRDKSEPVSHRIEDFFDFSERLLELTILGGTQQNYHLHSDDWHRTIYINTLGYSTFDFDLSNDDKEELIEQGEDGAEDYFAWYSDPDSDPANQP